MSFIRKYWVIILLATTAAVLGFLWFWGQQTSDKAPDRQEPAITTPALPKISFPKLDGTPIPEGTIISVLSSSPAQEVSFFHVIAEKITFENAAGVAEELGFQGKPFISSDALYGKVYSWSRGNSYLSIGTIPANLSLTTDSIVSPPESGRVPTAETAVLGLKNVLGRAGFNLDNLELGVSYNNQVLNNNVLETGIIPLVQGVPVLTYSYPLSPPVLLRLQKDQQFRHLEYHAGFNNPQKTATYPAKTTEDIQKSIKKEGVVIDIGMGRSARVEIIPQSIQIDKTTNALLFNPENPSMLLPIFILQGTTETSQGSFPITIFLPSVKSRYLQLE